MKRRTREQEADLVARAQGGDQDAWDALYDQYRFALMRFTGLAIARGVDRHEAESAANLGLLSAVQRFDVSRGTRFFTYLWHAMRSESVKADMPGPVRIPNMGFRTNREAAERTRRVTSIHNEDGRLVLDIQENREPTNFHEVVHSQRQRLAPLIRRLDRRSRIVIRGRLEGKALADIGEEIGVSKERVRQIQEQAVQKLRELV